jgi:glycosyltransferase involved in cell wall biosynthesis
MRFGVVWDPKPSASNYRAIYPAQMLQRLGHQAVPPPPERGVADVERYSGCDVVLVYRRYGAPTRRALRELRRRGVALVYDNDDDYTMIPKDHPEYDNVGDAFKYTLEAARTAHVMTVTTRTLADRYREHGVDDVRVIPNQLNFGAVADGRPHEGIVIGWVAGLEHRSDAEHIGMTEVLERLLRRHPDLRVECIGVDLGLSERYHHQQFVPFPKLPDVMAGWDIGLAPLEDTGFNRARSDIKVKEYAARGVVWVASPVGPYRDLGEAQGGRLVDDDEWYDALDRLIRKRRERRKLAAAGLAWARTQTIARTARDWEGALLAAIEKARG